MLLIIHGLRCLILQAGMRSLRVVKAEEAVNANACITRGVVLIEIYVLVFDSTPESLDKDVVVSPSPVIHADFGSGIEEDVRVFRACEVTALVRIHDLGRSHS